MVNRNVPPPVEVGTEDENEEEDEEEDEPDVPVWNDKEPYLNNQKPQD